MKNLIYFGSPAFSAEILQSILGSNQVSIVGIVTTPDQPQGRKQILTPSPLALLGEKHNLPVYKPARLDDDNLAHIKLLKPDIFLVVSYGKIIPKTWLTTPTLGTFNIHFSLLPKYRGALCIQEAIKNQDKETGVTLMEMDEQLDHGSIISQQKVDIGIDDDVATLTTKLTQAAKEILRQKLPEICAQKYTKTVQNESLAAFTPSHKTLTHHSAFIPWSEIEKCTIPNVKSKILHALIRSLNPEPGAWTIIPPRAVLKGSGSQKGLSLKGQEIKLLKTHLENNRLVINTVQLSGKNPISWKQFLSGHSVSFRT